MPSVVSVKTTRVSVVNGTKKKIITRKQLRKYSWLPDVLRTQGSILPSIIGPVLTVTLFATVVAYLWSKGYYVVLTNSVVPLFSVVVGLILVFRNGTSYDRYWEGRKDFATMISHIRNLTRLFWINVAVPPTDDAFKGKTAAANLSAAQIRRKKVQALKLCVVFAYAVKHYLRGEDGLEWEDYVGILPSTVVRLAEPTASKRNSAWTSYAATARTSREDSAANSGDEGESTGQSGASQVLEPPLQRRDATDATKRIRVKRSKDKLKQPGVRSPRTPLLSGLHRTIDFNSDPDSLTTPLPLVIAHELSRMIFRFKRDGYLETVGPAGTNAMNALYVDLLDIIPSVSVTLCSLQGMVDSLGAMERVANTPIPRSYSIHLKQTVTLYLFSLPFTLVNDLGWGMVPLVTVVAFTLMGIEGIADEIEMPFGLDSFDLPLERYCDDLKEEVEYIVEKLPEGGEGMYGVDDGEGDD